MRRSRLVYGAATLAVIALGLLSRACPGLLPSALGKYPGDGLWALMVFCGIGILAPGVPTMLMGLIAFTFSGAVEFSQLYQSPWIDSVRDTLPGRLILGRGFSWWDIMAYAIGIGIGCLAEIECFKFSTRKNSRP
jgi:hypothetical protein